MIEPNPLFAVRLPAALIVSLVFSLIASEDAIAGDAASSRLSLDPIEQVEAAAATPEFGTAGTEHWSVLGGVGFALENDDDSTDANLAIAYSRFLARDIEMVLELGAWGFFQDGDDAAGINPSLGFRWHFVNRQAWTLYGDLGIGLLFATDDVPDTGTSFNFMPRVGVGGTYRLTDDGTRLVGGVRWHHVSNARINGDDNNPDRDGVMVYAGVQFPF